MAFAPKGIFAKAFDDYAEGAEAVRRELVDSLSADEIDFLRLECVRIGPSKMSDRRIEAFQSVCEYVAASPSRRASLLESHPPDIRPILIWAGIVHVDYALRLLRNAAEIGGQVGNSPRAMASFAGAQVVAGWLQHPVRQWPFDPPNPFGDDES